MNDFTIGRKAGAGMIKKQQGGGGAQKFGSQRGRKDDGDQTPRKPRSSSIASDPPPSHNDVLPTSSPRRQPLYPSALSNASSDPTSPQRTPRPRRPQQQHHRPNRKDEGPIKYQSLEDLLRAAGYADVRIVTPESERLQARMASEKRRREERGFSSEDEESEVEALTKGVVGNEEEGGGESSTTTPSPKQIVEQASKPRGEAGGWLTWMSLGKKAGASAVREVDDNPTVKAVTRRRSALDMVASSSSSSNPLPPPPPPTRSFATPPDSPSPQTRRRPTAPVPTSNRVSSLSSTECGSLSSSLSTNASTMIASPPDVPSRSFRGMTGESPTLSQGTPDSVDRQWSPPRGSRATPVATRGDSESMRSLERARSQRSRAESRTREMERRSSRAEGSVEGRSRERSSVNPLARTGSADKGKKVATALDEDSLANSMAARSLRDITSQAALRATSNKIKPKSSFSFGSAVPSSSDQAPKPKPLRHAASTPFFSSPSSSSIPRPSLPPSALSKPSNSTQAVKASWFSTVSRNFFPTSLATPATTDTAFRRTANPHIRTRPSIPSFHPSLSNSSSTAPTTSLSSVSPRNQPLPTQVTSQTVFCSSESDEQLPAIVASSSGGPPTKTPVLSTKSSFSSGGGGGALSEGGGGGDAWKKNVAGAGWSWNVSTAMEEDLSFWGGDPSPPTPQSESFSSTSTSTASSTPSRSLNAKGSIASLRAALAASDLASSLLSAPPVPPLPTSSSLTVPVAFSPPPPPPEIMISSPGTLEAGLKPRLLDLDTEEFEGRDPPETSGGGRRIWGGGRGSRRVVRRKED
ncbi:hypothetical protein BDY24DRAFT_1434 [Mrakia frigida]|uniref:uncharacterized protein n=1 Tax=Mrakia frigida TaxID=29902 RepID=UPI003FCC0927